MGWVTMDDNMHRSLMVLITGQCGSPTEHVMPNKSWVIPLWGHSPLHRHADTDRILAYTGLVNSN